MKKTIFSLIIVAGAIAGLVALLIWNKQESSLSPQVDGVVTVEPTQVAIDHDSYLYSIEGSYPQFSQTSDSFNARIAGTVRMAIDEFKENADADYKARLEIGGDEFLSQFSGGDMYYFSVDSKVIQSTNKYVSVAIYLSGYAGGAHGYHVVTTFNYDVAANKELALTDFMTLEKAAELSRADLKKQFAKLGDVSTFDGFAMSGTDPLKPENYQSFTFNDQEVTIHFSEYQVAPYVYGEMKVVISR